MANNRHPGFYGLEDEQSVDPRLLRRDIQPIHQQLLGGIRDGQKAAFVIVGCATLGGVFPLLLLPMAILAGVISIYAFFHAPSATLPLRLPEEAERPNHGDPAPSHSGWRMARGVFFLGNAWIRLRELWLSVGDMLTHLLILGTTGSGKTEALVSLAYNALAMGSGYWYIDPKAAPKLAGQHFYMTRLTGRDDDIRYLNFAIGQKKIGRSPRIRSNTLQPFAFGIAEALKEIPLSLIPVSADDKNAIFSKNAKALMTSLMFGLVDLRNIGEIPLSVEDLRVYTAPDKFIELAQRKEISARARRSMQSFLTSMGWKPNTKRDQWDDFDRQYSYASNYFMEALGVMSDTYAHIFNIPRGEINPYDIIKQRRVLVTLLPSLEKSKLEGESLGKITLAQARLAMAVGLGSGNIMGSWNDVVESLPVASKTPFVMGIDEYAAIAIPGFEEMFTQGRGLGVSMMVGSQDYPGMQRADEFGAKQVLANTKVKLIFTQEDPTDTRKLIVDLAGETEEMRTQGYSLNNINYADVLGASVQHR